MEAWFLSDIHLKDPNERNGKILLRFLHSLRDKNPAQVHLFLLGDIFDLWVGGHNYFAEKFKPLIQALKDLKAAGAKITFIEGNHDMHIENFFQKKLGIEVFVEAQYYQFDGVTVRCEHGDKINQNDIAYKRYRRFVRNPLIKQLAIHLPGRFWNYIGEKASKKSRSISANYRVKNEDFLITMIRNHIDVAYKQGPFDFIISGHMHVFDDHTVSKGERVVRSINLGSWFEETVKVFRIENGQGTWVNLE